MILASGGLDDKINGIEHWQRCVRTDQPPVTGPDVAALGRALGFDGNVAQRTIDAYNRACPTGVFDPRTPDGLATVGLSPGKSNYAMPLDRFAPSASIGGDNHRLCECPPLAAFVAEIFVGRLR